MPFWRNMDRPEQPSHRAVIFFNWRKLFELSLCQNPLETIGTKLMRYL